MQSQHLSRVLLLSSLGLLSACGGGGGGESDPAPQVSEFTQAYTQMAQLSDAEKYQEIGQREITSQRRLMTWSGLETELGGAAATDSALNDIALAIATMAETEANNLSTQMQKNLVTPAGKARQSTQYKSTSSQVRLAAGSHPGGAFLGLGMSYMQGGLATSLGADGNGGSVTASFGQLSGTQDGNANVAIDTGTTHYDSELNTVINGMDVKLKTKIDMNQCPDNDGKVSLHFVSDSRIVKQNTLSGTDSSFDITISVKYDDNANTKFDKVDYLMRTQLAAFDSGKGTFMDVTWKNNAYTVNRASSQATSTDFGVVLELAKTGYVLALSMLMKSQDAVENGRCIRVDVATDGENRTDLEPSTPFQITASPRSKIDNTFVGGTVKATLTGGSSLNPANTPVIADGVFSYAAPDTYGQTATVNLEARSKRGVGKSSVTFSTKKVTGYTSTFNYSLVNDAVKATADVIWTYVPGAGDAIDAGAKLYRPSGTVNATFSYPGCTPITKVLNVDEDDTNSLIIYSPTSAKYPGKYSFTLSAGTAPQSTSVFTCGKNTLELPTSVSMAGASCDAQVAYTYTSPAGFSDVWQCGNYSTYSWEFTQQ